jgi:hypothetical protein
MPSFRAFHQYQSSQYQGFQTINERDSYDFVAPARPAVAGGSRAGAVTEAVEDDAAKEGDDAPSASGQRQPTPPPFAAPAAAAAPASRARAASDAAAALISRAASDAVSRKPLPPWERAAKIAAEQLEVKAAEERAKQEEIRSMIALAVEMDKTSQEISAGAGDGTAVRTSGVSPPGGSPGESGGGEGGEGRARRHSRQSHSGSFSVKPTPRVSSSGIPMGPAKRRHSNSTQGARASNASSSAGGAGAGAATSAGGAAQDDTQLESAWFQLLNLKCDILVSKLAFKFNLHRYALAATCCCWTTRRTRTRLGCTR